MILYVILVLYVLSKLLLTGIKKKEVKIASNREMAKRFHKALFKDLKVQKQNKIGTENS